MLFLYLRSVIGSFRQIYGNKLGYLKMDCVTTSLTLTRVALGGVPGDVLADFPMQADAKSID